MRSQSKIKNIKNMPELFENQIVDDEQLLTKKQIAIFLNVSIKMIDRKVSMNEIPYLRIGRLIRFSKKQILVWANENNPRRGIL